MGVKPRMLSPSGAVSLCGVVPRGWYTDAVELKKKAFTLRKWYISRPVPSAVTRMA